MSRAELREHWSYWRDTVKVDCYRRALAAAVRPGDVVLDLGCGTGLLGLLACEAGAARVYAVDAGPIINVAREIAAASPHAERIVHLREMSTRVELPELVDVVVADQIGGMGFDAGTNEYFADARRRLAKPDARFVPAVFTVRIVPACIPAEHEELAFWRSAPLGFDLAALATAATNSVRDVYEQTSAAFLGRPVEVARLCTWSTGPIEARTSIAIERGGTMHGLLGMFVADMGAGVRMTNDPTVAAPMRTRWQDLLPVDGAIDVEPGDELDVLLRADPLSYQITWSVTVRRDGACVASSVQSSALGAFFGRDDLGEAQEAPPRRLAPWRWALDEIAAGATPDRLARDAADRFGELLGDERSCRHWVDDVWSAVR